MPDEFIFLNEDDNDAFTPSLPVRHLEPGGDGVPNEKARDACQKI